MVGSEMVQTGCFSARAEPTGINRVVRGPQTQEGGYYFRPVVENELLYSGRAGDILHVTYREYNVRSDGYMIGAASYARPAYAQQVQYDLRISDVIVFQQWVIRVLDADNQMIRFMVIKEPPLDEWNFY